MTIVLAIDAATGGCSVAVARDGVPLAAAAEAMSRGHAEVLMPMIQQVVAAAGIAWPELTAIAATVGPGSFTGVRIGLAAARGLALATGAATVPITTLEAIAVGAGAGDAPLLVALDSKRRDLYAQWFESPAQPIDPPAVVTIDGLRVSARERAVNGALRLAGDAGSSLAEVLVADGFDVQSVPEADRPDACVVAALATERFLRLGGGALRPFYMRPPDVLPPR